MNGTGHIALKDEVSVPNLICCHEVKNNHLIIVKHFDIDYQKHDQGNGAAAYEALIILELTQRIIHR